jgi:hypothetical protein
MPDTDLSACTCMWSVTATSQSLHWVNPKCSVHGQGVRK